HRNIALISIIGAVSFFAIIGSISFLSDHLRTDNALLFTAADVGMIISIGGFIGIFFSPIAGRFIDVCSPRLAALVGMSITIPSVVLTAFVQDFYLFLTLSAFNGIGGAFLWTGLLTTAVAEIPRMRGTTSSIFNSSRFSGYAISPILLGPVYSHFNYIGIALTCGALLIIASLLAYILPRKKCKELSEQPSVPAGDQRR
ncbi:MAG: MFS transporter, partial [Thermoplasmata archaeon]|nr:MFS transporter [Thermoplasmata archaeon]